MLSEISSETQNRPMATGSRTSPEVLPDGIEPPKNASAFAPDNRDAAPEIKADDTVSYLRSTH